MKLKLLLALPLAGFLFFAWWLHTTHPAQQGVIAPRANPLSTAFSTEAPAEPEASSFLDRWLAAWRRMDPDSVRPSEALLTFANEAAYEAFLARAAASGFTVLGQIKAGRTVRVRYGSLQSLENDLKRHGSDYAEVNANALFSLPGVPPKAERTGRLNVPFGDRTLAFLGVTGDQTSWGRGITIAILDTGVAPDSTFGSGRLAYLDIGFGHAPDPAAVAGHGTAVAALAAGAGSDAAGVAPAAQLLSIRVTDASGTSDVFTVASAIIAAVEAGADIVNVSLGGYSTHSVLTQAIDYATARGVVIVAAAGNDQVAQLTWPAADPRVVSVGAIDAIEQQVAFSNSSPQLQITAPGYGVQTAWTGETRVTVDGTSASAPLVAGAIAALMSTSPELSAQQAWSVLQQYASDGGPVGPDPDYGHGILNLGWALHRQDPTYVDAAISSHHYDSASGQMQFSVQNRSSQALAGLELVVEAGGVSQHYAIPLMTPGQSVVVSVPVNDTQLQRDGALSYSTSLKLPSGVSDRVPTNNRKSSLLTTP